MKTKIKSFWERLHTSFWFLPTLMAITAALLAWGANWLDEYFHRHQSLPAGLIYQGDIEAARDILLTIASSMITVAGVTFSITIVALTLACSQLGPRLLRNFMRDRRNQFVLGIFIAAYLYCLLVLYGIGRTANRDFIPQISLMIALFYAVAGIGVLIYFIHHISVSIQADQAIALVFKDLAVVFKKHFARNTEIFHRRQPDEASSYESDCNVYPLYVHKSGYIEDIDVTAIFECARSWDGVMRIEHRQGHFITPQKPLLHVYTKKHLEDKQIESLRDCFILRNDRASEEDITFAINQLVEIALRALSTGINDAFTAMVCIDRLATAVILFIENKKKPPCIFDNEGNLRVIERMVTFSEFVGMAFDQIRHSAAGRPAIVIRLLERIRDILLNAQTQEQKDVLIEHATVIKNSATSVKNDPRDLDTIEKRYHDILSLLQETARQ